MWTNRCVCNRRCMMDCGNDVALETLLSACLSGCQEAAATAICSICQSNDSVRQKILEVGGLQPIAHMLTSPSLPIQHRQLAAQALFGTPLSIEPLDSRIQQHQQLGGMQPLLQLLQRPSPDCQATVALAIWCLCQSELCRMHLLHQFGKPRTNHHLISLFSSTSGACQETAAWALSEICERSPRSFLTSTKFSCLGPLIGMLSSSTLASQKAAVSALASCCACSDVVARVSQTLIDLKAEQSLTELLRSTSSSCQEHSAQILCEMCRSSKAFAEKLCKQGSLQPFISMLRAPLACQQEEAAQAITAICMENSANGDNMAKLGGVAPLLDLLKSPSATCQEKAALAVWTICNHNDAIRLQVVELGGLQLLIDLLGSPSSLCQENAARAVWHICKGAKASALRVVELGALKPLIDMTSSSSAGCQEHAAGAICAICVEDPAAGVRMVQQGGVAALMKLLGSSLADCQLTCAAAIWAICSANDAAVLQLNEMGGLSPFIHLLSSPSSDVQAHAAGAIASMVSQWSPTTSMTRYAESLRSLEPLLALLKSASAQCQQNAATAIEALCRSHMSSTSNLRSDMVRLGVLTALLALLSPSSLDRMQAASCAAKDRNVPQQTPAMPVLEAILAICDDNPAASLQLMEQRGMQLIISLLSCTSSCEREIAKDIFDAVQRATPIKFAEDCCRQKANLQPLISLLSSSSSASHIAAFKAITTLQAYIGDEKFQEQFVKSGGLQLLLDLSRPASADQVEAQYRALEHMDDLCWMKPVRDCLMQPANLSILSSLLSSSAVVGCGEYGIAGPAALVLRSLCIYSSGPYDLTSRKLLEAGFCPQLICMLGSWNQKEVSRAADVISFICCGYDTAQQHVIGLGGLQPLMSLLSLPHAWSWHSCIARAATSIASICVGNQAASIGAVNLDVLQSCIELLGYDDDRVRCAAAVAFFVVWGSTATVIDPHMELSGVQCLLELLESATKNVPRIAATVIHVICTGHHSISQKVVELDGLKALLQVLKTPSQEYHDDATRAICVICNGQLVTLQQSTQLGAEQLPASLASQFASYTQHPEMGSVNEVELIRMLHTLES